MTPPPEDDDSPYEDSFQKEEREEQEGHEAWMKARASVDFLILMYERGKNKIQADELNLKTKTP